MMDKAVFKKLSLHGGAIFIASSLLGIFANALNPHGVVLSSQRPTIVAVSDDILSIDLGETSLGGIGTGPDKIDLSEGPVIVNTIQLKKLLAEENTVLLDARPTAEFEDGHLPAALNVPFESFGDFFDKITGLPKDKWIICYCDGPPCDLGELLAFEVFMLEFPFVAIYAEGLDEWIKQGGQLEGTTF